jgi:hypothetical protein
MPPVPKIQKVDAENNEYSNYSNEDFSNDTKNVLKDDTNESTLTKPPTDGTDLFDNLEI